jgi:glycosyltransferase involved in cell wall biosynthesis
MATSLSVPRVSVLMAVRDGIPYLDAAIQSILTQTFNGFEFIIVNDGSTDGTKSRLEEWSIRDSRIRVFNCPAEGHFQALNFGLAQCRAEYVARMDADDIALPERLFLQAEHLDRSDEMVVVGGQTWAIDGDADVMFAIRCPTGSKEIEQSLLSGRNCLSHPTVMMRKSAVNQAGGYRDESPSEDYGLWLRMLDCGRLSNLPQFVLHYRLHAQASRVAKHAIQRQIASRLLAEAHHRRGTPQPDSLPTDYSPQTVARIHHHWAMSATNEGNWKAAKKHAKHSLRLEPTNLHAWWTYFKSLIRFRNPVMHR